MKKILFAMALAVAFVACNHNEPTDTKKDGTDTIPLHQPTDSTWLPIGHKYVSTDEEFPNREITFISKDSFLWKREDHQKVYPYVLKYPIIYVWEEKHPWLKFIDTLTISRKSNLADESSCYKLVY